VQISVTELTTHTEVAQSFHQSLMANAEQLPKLGHRCLIPHIFNINIIIIQQFSEIQLPIGRVIEITINE
jgi:hypothetical protein